MEPQTKTFSRPGDAYGYADQLERDGLNVSVYFDAACRVWVVDVNPRIVGE